MERPNELNQAHRQTLAEHVAEVERATERLDIEEDTLP